MSTVLNNPFLDEFLFILSTLVFVFALFSIVPTLMFDKSPILKSQLIVSMWQKSLKIKLIKIKENALPNKNNLKPGYTRTNH